MSLEDLKKKFHHEAATVGVQFWNPKVGESIIGEVTERKEINGQQRYIFHDVPRDQYFVLPSHGHLNKQLGENPIGRKLYIELSAESELKSGPGKGKMGKLYFVTDLSDEEWQEVLANEGTEPKLVYAPKDNAEDFDFSNEEGSEM